MKAWPCLGCMLQRSVGLCMGSMHACCPASEACVQVWDCVSPCSGSCVVLRLRVCMQRTLGSATRQGMPSPACLSRACLSFHQDQLSSCPETAIKPSSSCLPLLYPQLRHGCHRALFSMGPLARALTLFLSLSLIDSHSFSWVPWAACLTLFCMCDSGCHKSAKQRGCLVVR